MQVQRKKGVVLGLFILLLPVIVSLLGLVIDAGLFMYHQQKLDMATEAASVATISAYDRAVYASTRAVVIDPVSAEAAAQQYLTSNFSGAKIESVTALDASTIKVRSHYTHEFVFMKVFGVARAELYSECITIGG